MLHRAVFGNSWLCVAVLFWSETQSQRGVGTSTPSSLPSREMFEQIFPGKQDYLQFRGSRHALLSELSGHAWGMPFCVLTPHWMGEIRSNPIGHMVISWMTGPFSTLSLAGWTYESVQLCVSKWNNIFTEMLSCDFGSGWAACLLCLFHFHTSSAAQLTHIFTCKSCQMYTLSQNYSLKLKQNVVWKGDPLPVFLFA